MGANVTSSKFGIWGLSSGILGILGIPEREFIFFFTPFIGTIYFLFHANFSGYLIPSVPVHVCVTFLLEENYM